MNSLKIVLSATQLLRKLNLIKGKLHENHFGFWNSIWSLSGKFLNDLDGFYLGGAFNIISYDSRSYKNATGAKSDTSAYTASAVEADFAMDLAGKNGITAAVMMFLPYSTKTGTSEMEYNQTLALNFGWTHQF